MIAFIETGFAEIIKRGCSIFIPISAGFKRIETFRTLFLAALLTGFLLFWS
jgi:hypothetical protein